MTHRLQTIKHQLLSVVNEMSLHPALFVKNPRTDFSRNRKLSFAFMLKLILTMGGNTLRKELLDASDFNPATASVSAFVQQRDKILPFAFEFLLHEFTCQAGASKTYEGYRLLACDGSDLNNAHNPADPDTYFQTSPDSKGFNLLHLNALYDLQNHIHLDACVQPGRKENEYRAFTDMIDRSSIHGNVIVLADRGYESYNTFAHFERKGWNYLIRVKDLSGKSMVSSSDIPQEGEFDIPIHLILTRKQTNEVKADPKLYKFVPHSSPFDYLDLHENIYFPLSFRVVRLLLPNGEYEALITNLDPHAFPPDKLRDLYHLRWGIETSFRHLKYAISLAQFHSKKTEHIIQEIFARLVMYNFSQMVTSSVVISQNCTKHVYQVNFTAAVLICRQFLRCDMPPPDVEALLGKYILPFRPDRCIPRRFTKGSTMSFNYRIA